MAESQPIPVILCGKTEAIGQGIVAGFKPEIEVIQFILATEAALTEIPQVLRGESPAEPTSKLGTGNVSVRPKAIMLGGAYEDAGVEAVQKSIQGCPGAEGIVIFQADLTIPMPPIGPEYGKKMLVRAKEKVLEYQAKGMFDGTHGGVHMY